MQKNYVTVVFDRKKQIGAKGVGKVEIYIYLSRDQKKYITLKSCSEREWKTFQHSVTLANELAAYNSIIEEMQAEKEELTIFNLEFRLGMNSDSEENIEKVKKLSSPTGFIDFISEEIEKEKITLGTLKRKKVALAALIEWGKMNRFVQVTDSAVCSFNEWLRKSPNRSTVTINNYHKVLKMYTRAAYERGYIKFNPYDSPRCHFERGKCKERNPLTEDELLRVRELDNLTPKLERARDLFIFCAYTGLAYVDCQVFNFKTMAEKHNDTYFIDGNRIKTGNKFFTPILPPAMEILKKYKYQLPRLSNQKLNDYLHVVGMMAELNKPMTTHVARHSFATLVLSYDIPIENLARMLGHANIKTTQVYGKILKTTIERHAQSLSALIR